MARAAHFRRSNELLFHIEDAMNVSIRLFAIAVFCLALTAGCDKTEPTTPTGNDKSTDMKVKSGPQAGKKPPALPPLPSK
jgi:hypothetical protein